MYRLVKAGVIFNRIMDIMVVMAAVLLIFTMLSIGTEVVSRYFLNKPLFWVLEVSEYSLLFITFLGAAWLLRREKHVKMDLVLNHLGLRTQALLNIVTSIIGTIACLSLAWYSAQATWFTYRDGSVFPTDLEVPEFIILAIIPIGSLLLFIQFLRRTGECHRRWKTLKDTG